MQTSTLSQSSGTGWSCREIFAFEKQLGEQFGIERFTEVISLDIDLVLLWFDTFISSSL